MTHLFDSFSVKQLHLKNRIVMAPMCQYSVTAKDGRPNDWHFVHYVSRAVGGTGLIIMEMTDVEPDGRITDYDLGLWSDEQIPAFARILDACHQHGAKIGIQIAHAGRKAEDATLPVAPSPLRYPTEGYKTPKELTSDEVKRMVERFAQAARRAVVAGADMVELHGAHGYLIHQFHSPLTNQRTDVYGQNLAQFGMEVIQAVKQELPSSMPLFMRLSAMEYVDGGYDLNHALEICRQYKNAGVDVFHLSSGGEGPPGQRRPGNFPGFQVPLARAVKQSLEVPVVAVGMLEDPAVAESVLGNQDADLVAIARGLLRDPYWALHAAVSLRVKPEVPVPYSRAFH
ncbi:NADH:flavin oxidoreductase/NADH oxidase [Alicyclobacillaceae bacterium I2511]|nr:NADH:flavin oxidoreductase/NADH oxidase [Alicyclobacillaceae bacterium I2511]